jgi:hypothetical protein
MRFTIIGAGAVGVFCGLHLAARGHVVTYRVRSGRATPSRLRLVHAPNGAVQEVEPTLRALDAGPDESDWVLVCVRGDQVEDAMASVDRVAPAGAPVMIAAAVTNETLATLRARHPGRALVTLTPMFNAWPHGEGEWRWFTPPLMKNLLSFEDDLGAEPAARDLVRLFNEARIPSRAVASAYRRTLALFTTGLPMLAGWELSGWTPRMFRGAGELRALTARAMVEAGRTVRGEVSGFASFTLRLLAARLLSMVLALLPLLMPRNAVQMWIHHGPKIEAQTREMMDRILARAQAEGRPVPSLAALRERLPAKTTSSA